MRSKSRESFIIAISILFFFFNPELYGQVKEYDLTVKGGGGGIVLSKEIPIKPSPEIKGYGSPTWLYVVQLARFEDLMKIPDKFPKGSILWVNPDHPREKILLSGFYNSFEEAKTAAQKFKKIDQFKHAFARKDAFMIRYD